MIEIENSGKIPGCAIGICNSLVQLNCLKHAQASLLSSKLGLGLPHMHAHITHMHKKTMVDVLSMPNAHITMYRPILAKTPGCTDMCMWHIGSTLMKHIKNKAHTSQRKHDCDKTPRCWGAPRDTPGVCVLVLHPAEWVCPGY